VSEDLPSPPQLHPLLSRRWSPVAFDGRHELRAADVEALLEAARWAPSAGNSQPWAFIMSRRGEDRHRRLVEYLARSSARWAPSASLLVANLSHRYVEGTDWEYSEFSGYDLGQAVAHMTFQAQAMGLHVRQFRAFDRAAVADEFEVPSHWEVTSMSAVGQAATAAPSQTPELWAGQGRQRHSRAEITWPVPATRL